MGAIIKEFKWIVAKIINKNTKVNINHPLNYRLFQCIKLNKLLSGFQKNSFDKNSDRI